MADKETENDTQDTPPVIPPRHDWLDPGTWSPEYRFVPVYVGAIAVLIAIIYVNFFAQSEVDMTSYDDCKASFNYSFRINAASTQSQDWSKRGYEIGMAYEATLEIYNPERSVFGQDPFPGGKLPKLGWRMDEAALYAKKAMKLVEGSLANDADGSVVGPATMGIAALMLGQGWNKEHGPAAAKQKDILVDQAPRHSTGAISYLLGDVELRSEAIGMFPAFLAYYGVATNDPSLLRAAVHQCKLYRAALAISKGPTKGLWKHIAGPSPDNGAWSISNAWAAYGMAQTSAIVAAWPRTSVALSKEKDQLDSWIGEILDAAIRTDNDASGLLRNYLGDDTWDGETSGTSLMAATVYRMAYIKPEIFGTEKYINWADQKRRAVFSRVGDDGFARPAANFYASTSKTPVDASPLGVSFLILMGTAWRDCVCRGLCLATYNEEIQKPPPREITLEGLTGFTWEEISEFIFGRKTGTETQDEL